MIIDFHTHMFPDRIAAPTIQKLSACVGKPAAHDGTCAGLLASTRDAGIDLAIVLPIATKPSQFRSINDFAAQYQEGRLLSFGSVHPASEHLKEELRTIRQMGMKGVKLHPDYQDMYFNDIRYKRLISYATELGLAVIVHAGMDPLCPEDIHCTPQMAAELIDEVRPEKLILAHLGGNEQWDDVEHYLVGKNVYFDTGVVFDSIPEEQFIRIMRNHGAGKILFATDSPWADQRKFVDIVKNLKITDEEREMMFWKNGAGILNL